MKNKPTDSSEGQFIVVFVTTSTEKEANKIARTLVERDLIACANLLPLNKSIFKWEGKVMEEQEVLLLLKSRRDLFEHLSLAIKQLHSYEVPEIIATPVIAGSPDYLDWVMANTHN